MLPLHLCVLTKNSFQKKGQTKVLMRICFLDHNVIDILGGGDGELVSIFEILVRIQFCSV